MTGKPPGESAAIGEAFAEAHSRLVADKSIQFELQPPDAPTPTPDWLKALIDLIRSDAMEGVFWVLIATAALGLLYLIVLRLRGLAPPGRRNTTDEPADWRPQQGPARQLLGEADFLAEQGRYSEAAHLLLHKSIEDIETRRPDLLRPALTSRDIAGLQAIPDHPRSAFERMAMLVERSLFAMRPLEEAHWRECRTAYEQFAFAESWAA